MSARIKWDGLKARLSVIVLLAMLPVLCIALFMAVQDYRAAKRSAVENSRQLTQLYAAAGNALIERARLLMRQAADMPGAQRQDLESCRRIVAVLSSQRKLANGAAVYKPDGQPVCASGFDAAAARASAAAEPWFTAALRTKSFAIGRYRPTPDGRGDLPLALPLTGPDGAVRHVLCLALNLDGLSEFLDDQALPAGASASVIDGAGTILARYPWTDMAVGKNAPGSEGFLPDLRSFRQDTWEDTGVDGVPRIYFLSHLAGEGTQALFLRVGVPADGVFAQARRNLARNVAFIGLMAGAVLVCVWFFSNALVLRHIRKLWQATRKLSEGDYAHRVGPVGGGELGELALAFDQMAGALELRTAQLERTELKYREFFENSMAGIFRATPDGRLHEANKALARLLGYGETGELMEHVRDIGLDMYAEPGRRSAVLERLNRDGAVCGEEFPARCRNGSLVWLSLDARTVRTDGGEVAYYEGMVSDVTHRREVEQELRLKQEKLQALLEHSPALICVKDKAGRYQLANRRHEEVRAGGRHVAGRTVWEIFPPDAARRILEEDAMVLSSGKSLTCQRDVEGADGLRHYVTVKFPLGDDRGRPDRVGSISYDVTDLERTREALRRSEEKYRTMIQTSPDLIWLIDPEGRLAEVNSASRELIGYDPEDLRGRHFHQFFEPEDLRLHDLEQALPLFAGKSPSDGKHPKLINERRQMPRSTRNLNVRLRAKGPHAEGDPRDFELSACGLWQDMRFMGTIVVIRDIAERRRSEAALRQSRELLDQTQEMARIGGWSLNLSTRERSWTKETARLLNLGPGGLPDFAEERSFLVPQDREALREAMAQAEEQGQAFDLELRLEGSPATWVRLMARRADAEGARILSGVIRDITARKEYEQLKADIDGIVRHDLKAPLNGIINLPQLIRLQGNLTSEQEEYLQLIEDSGRSMLRQIDMSLDIMRIEQGRYVCTPAPCDLAGILREVAASLGRAFSGKDVAVDVFLGGRPLRPEDTLYAWGEERLCHPLLANLVVNAMEASPPGGRVAIALEAEECAQVIIRNAGAVPQSLRGRFFEKYATSGKTTGTGLGTYSSRLFAEAQGGGVELDASAPGATTLIVRLPLAARSLVEPSLAESLN